MIRNNFFKNKNYSAVPLKSLKKVSSLIGIVFLLLVSYIFFQVYVPADPASHETVTFTAQKGLGDDEIGNSLQKMGIIRSSYFFKFYVILSLRHSSLKAGDYIVSPKMSIYEIANEISQGNVIKDKIVVYEGWDINDIGKYLESRDICTEADFVKAASKDYSSNFDFLKDLPRDRAGKPSASLEGYLFPDTYEISKGETCDGFVLMMLENFDKKLTPDLRAEITRQKKSIFDVVTMASLIEKEVRTLSDKKIVSGILWKRLLIGMALQLDSTINYITNGNDPSVSIKNTKIDSPYNTYKYPGLPKGPISNSGIDSINAAIYPTATKYWFYLSDGKTYFSETLDQHNAAKAKYLD